MAVIGEVEVKVIGLGPKLWKLKVLAFVAWILRASFTVKIER